MISPGVSLRVLKVDGGPTLRWNQGSLETYPTDVIFPGDLIVSVNGVGPSGDLDGDLNAMVLEFQRREYLMALVRAEDA